MKMFRNYGVVYGLCLVSLGVLGVPALAEKPTAPVEIEYSLPATIQSGDEIVTPIRLTAETDLIQILVSVEPGRGVEILSDQKEARFLDVKLGETREFEVRIRLTDAKEGFLNVFGTTTSLFQTKDKAIVIPYRVTETQGNP